MSTFSIVRASVPRHARIGRQEMAARLEDHCGAILAEQLQPSQRNARDALRKAISYRLRPVSRMVLDGQEYYILSAEAKDNKAFVVEFHVQQRGEKVDYLEVGSLTYREGEGVKWITGRHGTLLPGLPGTIMRLDGQEVLGFGLDTLFDNDLRAILDKYLHGKILRLWPGVYIALDAAERQAVLQAKALMNGLDEGAVTVSLLNLEDTKANREALALELAQEFIRVFEDITARAAKPGPNIELLEEELTGLSQRKATAELLLGVEIPCLDAQLDAEMAVGDLLAGKEA